MNEIPKKIHYCWFGRKPLPKSAIKCIESWKKYFPTYEIIEWNEDNYDINKIFYTKEAYFTQKYAFVSDYARFDILYHNGGIYFDTDVEVIKSFDDILAKGAFMGCEHDGAELTISNSESGITVNPGLGIAVPPGIQLYKELLDYYDTIHFMNNNGTINTETVVTKTTNILIKKGLKNINRIQTIDNVTIYPKEYFNPMNNNTGTLNITQNTHSIHWYSMSWISPNYRLKSRLTRPIHRIFGDDCFKWLKRRRRF